MDLPPDIGDVSSCFVTSSVGVGCFCCGASTLQYRSLFSVVVTFGRESSNWPKIYKM